MKLKIALIFVFVLLLALNDKITTAQTEVETFPLTVKIGIAKWVENDDFNENIQGFVNTINTIEGGTHVAGLKSALTRVVNDYGTKKGTLKKGDIFGTHSCCGKVKIIEDFQGVSIDTAPSSAPAVVLGPAGLFRTPYPQRKWAGRATRLRCSHPGEW